MLSLVMKADDDAFINMFSLLPRLNAGAETNVTNLTSWWSLSSSSRPKLLLCNAWHESLVAREGKWRIDTTEWRYTYWPTFCQGVAFIVTMNFIAAATHVVHRVPRLWLDDVSCTH